MVDLLEVSSKEVVMVEVVTVEVSAEAKVVSEKMETVAEDLKRKADRNEMVDQKEMVAEDVPDHSVNHLIKIQNNI
jgi:hypothetical protein